MEDICLAHFSRHSCADADCPHAHSLSQLTNIEQWVTFDAPHIEMLDFLAYKYHSHHFFKFYKLPSGPLVRFASAEDAFAVVRDYTEYYHPQLVANVPETQVIREAPGADSCEVSRDPKTDLPKKSVFSKTSACIPIVPIKARLMQTCAGSQDSLDFCGSDEVFSSASGSLEPDSNNSNHLPSSYGSDGFGMGSLELPRELTSPYEYNGTGSFDYGTAFPQQMQIQELDRTCSYYGPPRASLEYNTRGHNGRSGRVPHHSWTGSCTEVVLRVLRDHAANPVSQPYTCGWLALHQIWGIQQECLDRAVLSCLSTKLPHQQEQILLSFASIDLASVNNLSAYLNCLIKEHETTNQVCLHFLAGLCSFSDCCYVHPVNTAGWNALHGLWNVTYKDLDYAVLNYLSKKTMQQQDEILLTLADSNLQGVVNLSAYLSSQIQKYETAEARNKSGFAPQFGNKKFGRYGKGPAFEKISPTGIPSTGSNWGTHHSSRGRTQAYLQK